MAPDVAIVGEVRDRGALPLLLTLSSGFKGFTTIHASSARQLPNPFALRVPAGRHLLEAPMAALNSLVSEAVDVMVHCAPGAWLPPGHREGRPASSQPVVE